MDRSGSGFAACSKKPVRNVHGPRHTAQPEELWDEKRYWRETPARRSEQSWSRPRVRLDKRLAAPRVAVVHPELCWPVPAIGASRAMQIGVVPDYVSAPHYFGENVRRPLDSTADDEKHRSRSMGIESVQYPRSYLGVRAVVEGQEDRRAVLRRQTLHDQFPRQRTFQSSNHDGERPRAAGLDAPLSVRGHREIVLMHDERLYTAMLLDGILQRLVDRGIDVRTGAETL